MNWSEITVYTKKEGIDEVVALINDCGAEGAVIEDEEDFLSFLSENRSKWDYVDEELLREKHRETNVKTYVPLDESGFEIIKKIEAALESLKKSDIDGLFGSLRLEVSKRDDSEWKDKWKEYFKPFAVGESFFVCPAWEDALPPDGRKLIKLETGQLFGTGLHATTRLCLCEIEKTVKAGDKVLDLGTGSGILAVAAVKSGAATVRAIDIDENVYATLAENARLNGIESGRLDAAAGDVLRDASLFGETKYDVITANIVADVIIALAPKVKPYLKEKGVFIVSGIIDARAREVETAIRESGYIIKEHRNQDGWNMFSATV